MKQKPQSMQKHTSRSKTRRSTDGSKPAVRRRGRPVGDHDAKRAELIAAAIAVVAEEGYAGASLRKVAQRAGCTTGAVTYYFANKEAVVTAIVEYLFDQFDALLEGESESVDVKSIFQRWLDRSSADANMWYVLFQLLAHARREPTSAGIFEQRYARYRRRMATVLERGQREGTVRSDIRADLLADQLSAMGDGWMMTLPIEHERFKPRRIQALLDATISMIAPPSR